METVIQTISTAAALVALLLIWQQLRYQSKQMKFEALTQLHQQITGDTMHEALRFIYASEPNDLAHPKSEEELKKLEFVLITYDLVGFRVRQGVLPEGATLETEWAILLNLWPQVQPFIELERQLRGGAPYKQHFEWLVKRAEDFKRRHYPKCELRIHKREFGEVTTDNSAQHAPADRVAQCV